MKLLRLALMVAALVLMVGGYASSQRAAFGGAESLANYYRQIDQPSIRWLALLLLAAAVVLAFLPEREEADS